MEWLLMWVLIGSAVAILLVVVGTFAFLAWTFLDEKCTAIPGRLPDFHRDLSDLGHIRWSMHFKREYIWGCLPLFAPIWITGLGLLAWQCLSPNPSNLWFGLGFALLGLGVTPFLWMFWTEGGFGDTIPWYVALLLTVVIFGGGYLALVEARDTVPRFYADYRRASLTHADIEATITVAPTAHDIGTRGTVIVTTASNSELPLSFRDITLFLPKDFGKGFVVDYQSLAADTIVDAETVVFGQSALKAKGVSTHTLPIVAHETGDYSGTFKVRLRTSSDSALRGQITISEKVKVVIVP